MNKIVYCAVAALMTTSAFAADKTGYAVNAQSENYGIFMGNGTASDFNEDADVIGLNVDAGIADLKIELVDEGDENDFRVTVGKTLETEIAGVTFGLTPEVEYYTGDSYDDAEVRFSPIVSASINVLGVTPFVLAEYDFVTTENALDDFQKTEGLYAAGVTVPLTQAVSVTTAYQQNVDVDWKETDEEVNVTLNVAF